MNPMYEKSPGGEPRVNEVLMPGDLCSHTPQNGAGYQQSVAPPSNGNYAPTAPEYSDKPYANHSGLPAQPQRQASSQYRQAVAIPNLGMSPAPVDCPCCGQRCMTNVSYHSGNTTHVWAVMTCCLTGLFCFVPYLMNSLKDVQHRCGNCGVLLATWHKSGAVDVHMHA
ncbi:hypothetical protein A1O3_00227 [Capronia epimyces CBS 606.96]|uniref:LITAF domain-containing protein n=1 Tax=Capronia epimyces CBS 606.96 TaxID=1182542 RepID=W9YFL2_9EURO|nr:uncharacterized protein A1O3_00227 [Capronia epimyces CBS 606.96]EXJ91677.1 hypothetical protein A1O3_00227 [Capronia epimyces CBS 606.96]